MTTIHSHDLPIGLRHVLEDGVTILEGGRELQATRRERVLENLYDFIDRAKSGAETTSRVSFIASAKHASAIDTYAFLFRNVDAETKADLTNRLTTTMKVISGLKTMTAVSGSEKTVAKEFLGGLLSRLKYESALHRYVSLDTSEFR